MPAADGVITPDQGQQPEAAGPAPDDIRAVPVRHPARWLAVACVGMLAAMLVHTLITNPRFEWGVVGQYFTEHAILIGLLRTLELTALAMTMGIVLGVILAIMRLSPNPVLSATSWAYIWFFRGTPLLVQLIFWYNVTALFPRLSLGVPFGPEFVSGNANSLVSAFGAAVLGLGLNEGAYMAEIVRAGILGVDEGQIEAAHSLGLRRLQVLRRIILPQAMRTVIPPTGNQTISMLKSSSLVSVISVPELLFTAQIIYARTYQTVPLLLVASLWYLAVTTILTIGQYYVERHFAAGSSRYRSPTPLRRLRGLAAQAVAAGRRADL
ncbi:MAG TPA: amino acid ABC transporter permease [Streptosporangiaceae bacterium]|jgi:polar amino acid transport system permease protein|nr:amino acid ABC transporter permease [Streptosporangiaceae bacterium]